MAETSAERWASWLAMDNGALDLDQEDRLLLLRECHVPAEWDDMSTPATPPPAE